MARGVSKMAAKQTEIIVWQRNQSCITVCLLSDQVVVSHLPSFTLVDSETDDWKLFVHVFVTMLAWLACCQPLETCRGDYDDYDSNSSSKRWTDKLN